jgi:hypothetical protein
MVDTESTVALAALTNRRPHAGIEAIRENGAQAKLLPGSTQQHGLDLE